MKDRPDNASVTFRLGSSTTSSTRLLRVRIHRSAAGYYIGTYCGCGPYSRESGYYLTRELAQADLDSGAYGR